MIRVLMFGWEFPPYKSGGLGTACYGLTKGLAKQKTKVTFIMPFAPKKAKAKFVKLIGTGDISQNVKVRAIKSALSPYLTSTTYEYKINKTKRGWAKQVYGKDLFEEVERYTSAAGKIAKEEPHDVIHAHDWMTYKAGILAKKASKKPLIVHLHATEFDRTGGNPDHRIAHAEWEGLKAADKIITNSNFSKENIIRHYKIKPEKIEVVHWGIHDEKAHSLEEEKAPGKTVLFLGRVTIQKGPDHFLKAAKKVLEYEPETNFILAGSGDMLERCIRLSAELGISDKVVFTGMLRGDDVHRAFKRADLFVMPSVAEPFGLVALEALKNGTPVIVSKQSGVQEVLNHALKVDFWDIDEMANKIVSVLRYDTLREELRENGVREVALEKFTLDAPARKVRRIYEQIANN
ncbi:glycosyltransferase family 1 protein [Candidatus Woesearchaeota archaeon]|nr:MAG: glycosyltransferase family 1 protein [Candidatus Woesearchaeota archaeon]